MHRDPMTYVGGLQITWDQKGPGLNVSFVSGLWEGEKRAAVFAVAAKVQQDVSRDEWVVGVDGYRVTLEGDWTYEADEQRVLNTLSKVVDDLV